MAKRMGRAPHRAHARTVSTPRRPTMSAPQRLFTEALQNHQAGQLEMAAQLYRQVLEADPRHADALHWLGVLAHQVGRNDLAADIIGQAIQVNAAAPLYYANLGNVMKELGRFDEAVAAYQTAIRLKPDFAQAYSNLGATLCDRSRFDEAVAAYQAAIRLQPDFTQAHANLGAALYKIGHFDEAVAAYQTAVRLQPDFPKVHANLGAALYDLGRFDEAVAACNTAIRLQPDFAQAHANLGAALCDLGRFDEAVAACNAAISLQPDLAQAYSNLGNALRELGRFDEAVAAYQTAIRLQPDFTQAYSNLGVSLCNLGRSDEAVTACNTAIRFQPDFAPAHANLGATLCDLGRSDEGASSFRTAIRLQPDLASAHTNLGYALLRSGDFLNGWKEYEWRWHGGSKRQKGRSFTVPQWQGEDIGGRTILLHAEQGLGDTIQFCRYAPQIAARGARVVMEVQRPLLRLLSTLPGVERLVTQGDALPAFDVHCPLMSVPLAFGTQVATIPASIPYLSARPEKAAYWRDRLGPRIRPRVGLVWNGGFRPDQPELWAVNARRNFPLWLIARLNVPHIDFFSLQKGEPAEGELAALRAEIWPGDNFHNPVQELNDFEDTAGLIENLDLVISVDTSTAHLAGAMGKPVWLLNRFDTCWRWFQQRDDSPWYPTLRLFRQTQPGDWDGVIQTVAAALAQQWPRTA